MPLIVEHDSTEPLRSRLSRKGDLHLSNCVRPNVAVAARTGNAAGQFTVGQALRNDVSTEYFAGDIDDVYAYQEVLNAEEVDNLMRQEAP